MRFDTHFDQADRHTANDGTRHGTVSSGAMSRVAVLLVVMGLVAAACTSGDTDGVVTSTSVATPLTTLPPVDGTTDTSQAPPSTSSSTTTTAAIPAATLDCTVTRVASVEGYTRGCEVLGMRLLAADQVVRDALTAQAERVFEMLRSRPDLADALASANLEGRVIGSEQRIDDLPEFAELYDQYPGTDWRRRGRSFPGTDLVPTFAGAEENLVCLEDDIYEGEDIFVREFGLTIKRFGLDVADPATSLAIEQAYGRAIAQGLWENTLAEINEDEYWMEGTQSYFDANLEDASEEREPNSSHNEVDTREELRDYDPTLWTILESVYGDTDWRPTCP